MSNDLIKIINDLFSLINEPINIIYKLEEINNCKEQLNIGKIESFGEYYFSQQEDKKEKGLVYTPEGIAKYIIESTIKAEDIINNPFLKILDPACGCGNIIIPCFKYLRTIYLEKLNVINSKNNLTLSEASINMHIISNNLFGFDIDPFALKILKLDLLTESEFMSSNNFNVKDFLVDEIQENYDIIIGNPPYIGQKSINKDYSLNLKNLYNRIYKDKGDVSYCFFAAALEKLKSLGKLTYITSRYFLESPSGENLRIYLKEICSIEKIVDFYGVRPFKNTGIDPVIVFTTKEGKNNEVQVIKPIVKKQDLFYSSFLENKIQNYNTFYIKKSELRNTSWILRDNDEQNIIKKIEEKCEISLENICYSYQGVITGCDKAFIIEEKNIREEELETDIIRPWIKSSSIEKNLVKKTGKFIIYSNSIQEEDKYKNSINHILPFKERLMKRRECMKGLRSWYQLQWGRTQSIFEGEKIVFPYKSSNNRFALDTGSYFSADIYCLVLKKNNAYSYEYILKLLNSKLYEYYFKAYAKKLGKDLYDYYPNNLMKLKMPNMQNIKVDIDEYLYSLFQITRKEQKIINEYVSN
ncbi:Eco57I restriction-modification methylase domain-containing protein [Candidatus Clostridium stratigraminis]|uniref:site-specific DNA-methyltransferase (adenine-specific) n=1 Tax=Candidatus Clostridium stratigraminis TaxID=3381661 RepID=A0ABW8T2X2_9CLOT